MSAKEFIILIMVCVIWGLHFPVMRLTVTGIAEPLFYAALRMSLVALILIPKLKWHTGNMKNIGLAGLCFGALNYAFMFPAMQMATASAAAITIELYVPFSIILAVIFLGERIGLIRITGIVLAFAGVVIISLAKPDETAGEHFTLGLILIACGAMSEAFGAIMVKTVKTVGPLQLLAWFAVIGSLVLAPLSFALEQDQLRAFNAQNLWPFLMALAYSVILVSIVAHASYYWLLGRLPMSIVAGSGYMTTLVAVTSGIVFLGEPASWPLFIGGSITLAGVGLILIRQNQKTSN